MFRVVLDERKRREIDPTLAVLRECIAEAAKDKETHGHTQLRLRDLADFFLRPRRRGTARFVNGRRAR